MISVPLALESWLASAEPLCLGEPTGSFDKLLPLCLLLCNSRVCNSMYTYLNTDALPTLRDIRLAIGSKLNFVATRTLQQTTRPAPYSKARAP
jgi:hypothetical protein